MNSIKFEGQIKPEQPATIQIGIRPFGEDEPTEEIDGLGIIDTGSKQCVINVGVLGADLFIQDGDSLLANGIGRQFDSRHCQTLVSLRQNGAVKEFKVPVYEMPIGLFRPGTPVMLVGRTILNLGVLNYDGVNQKWSLTFSDD